MAYVTDEDGTLVETKRIIPADNFVATVNVNVDNDKLTDAEFREFIRTTLPFIIYEGAKDD